MNTKEVLLAEIQSACKELFNRQLNNLTMHKTNSDFGGATYSLHCFNIAKPVGKQPEAVAHQIGKFLQKHSKVVTGFNEAKGFLNLVISDAHWMKVLKEIYI